MTIRTSSTTVTFRQPFFLGGLDKTLPAGTYDVETDEELLEGISFPAYRRIATLFHLHATSADPGRTQTFFVDPKELDAALERDEAPGDMRADEGPAPIAPIMTLEVPTMLEATADVRREKADRQALDRAEDEGMIAYPPETGAPQRQHALAGSGRAQHVSGEHDMPPADSNISPQDTSPEAAEDMAAYGITRVLVEQFHYRGFRYTNLPDAVAQAKRQQRLG